MSEGEVWHVQKPKWDKPAPPPPQALGMVQLLIKEAELDASEACFLLLHCGAQWGRSVTLPSSKTHNFNWEVRIRRDWPSCCRAASTTQADDGSSQIAREA